MELVVQDAETELYVPIAKEEWVLSIRNKGKMGLKLYWVFGAFYSFGFCFLQLYK